MAQQAARQATLEARLVQAAHQDRKLADQALMALVAAVVTATPLQEVQVAQAVQAQQPVCWDNTRAVAVVGKGMQDQTSTPLVGLAVVMVAAALVVLVAT
jgi:hypothetical protein